MLNIISLGGNALNTPVDIDTMAGVIYKATQKASTVITHGNGPQVGELASVEHKKLAVLTAQTEAELGLTIEDALLRASNGRIRVEVVLTKVLVDKNDGAFRNPTKPIGRFYNKREAYALSRKGLHFKHLINGYRRVVASPKPLRVLNLDSIKNLLRTRYTVIAAGGGGIAVFYEGGRLKFAEAVIDKDYTACLLAKSLRADRLFVLTNVNGVYLNFKKRNQRMLERVTAKELRVYLDSGQFEEGSMKPKVEACFDFVETTRKVAVIGSISKIKDVLELRGCTVIEP